eukprot:TRINITY_DN10539_c0_g1_i2.p1 TRINITY_DN10539_c0_g1~~TRINITY_DN10539_c0_g1_i2.p1  ORF type:complete len:148 (-),score=32.52 TRINITY_DN10539_c0_g1_i2:4-447(-)
MSKKCPMCTKPVYFAERVSGAGYDYHRLCLKCKNCGKALAPGNFAENRGIVYCKPCYGSGYKFANEEPVFLDAGDLGNASGAMVHAAEKRGQHAFAIDAPLQVVNADTRPTVPGVGTVKSPPAAKFCSNCGASATGGKFCTGCGSAL